MSWLAHSTKGLRLFPSRFRFAALRARYPSSPNASKYNNEITRKTATESIHKQYFSAPDLPTPSVTVYPSRAAIVRDIANVAILPGRNEITVENLTPNAEENSINVEACNTAGVITEVAVDLVANALYDPQEDSIEDEGSSPNDEDGAEVLSLKATIEEEKEAIALLEDKVDSLHLQLGTTDEHLQSWATKTTQSPSEAMHKELRAYHESRIKTFSELQTTRHLIATREASVDEAKRKLDEAVILESQSAAQKARAIRKRERESARLERQKTKPQMTKDVYRVRITIELESPPKGTTSGTAVNPTSRSESVEDAVVPAGNGGEPSLRLSYVTSGASWTPRYDVRLDTLANTGVLTYRAEVCNHTGEAWGDARIALSTSQASVGGLEDKAPWMDSWRVSLKIKSYSEKDYDGKEGLYSKKERKLRDKEERERRIGRHGLEREYPEHDGPFTDDDKGSATTTLTAPSNSLDATVAHIESYGLTTTYGLPGIRTVIPTARPSRYIIAEHKLTDVTFSHHSVPKLCPSVFYKACIHNRFPIALLRGPAGVSLDGTFLGTAAIPFCAPGNHFELGLGRDESVLVEYREPTCTVAPRRHYGERPTATYKRCISIYNARKTGISLVVSDQVPVPTTSSLVVQVKKPLELKVGETVKGAAAGIVVVCAPEMIVGGLADAAVEMKDDGEVRWKAKVEAGRKIMIGLEYEAQLSDQGAIVEEE